MNTDYANDNREERIGYICDDCEKGRELGCSHAVGRHYDVWGEGITPPDWCPQHVDDDDELPF